MKSKVKIPSSMDILKQRYQQVALPLDSLYYKVKHKAYDGIKRYVHLLTFQLIFIILVRVIICDETLWPAANWEVKCLFGLHFHSVVHHWRKVGQELKQGRKPRDRSWWQKLWESMAYWLAQQAFLENPGSPAQGWDHPQWAGPSWINH